MVAAFVRNFRLKKIDYSRQMFTFSDGGEVGGKIFVKLGSWSMAISAQNSKFNSDSLNSDVKVSVHPTTTFKSW